MTPSMKTIGRYSIAALPIGLSFVLPLAFLNVAQAFEANEKTQIEQIVREYLLANPEIIMELQDALEVKQAAQTASQQKALLASASDQIFNDPLDAVFGNANGDVTIVEFFDYNCGFCRRGVADMQNILQSDPNVKFVLKEFPIFGPNSIAVHTVAIAFNKIAPEKYLAYHIEMMGQEGQIDEDRALEIAAKYDVDMEALRREMSNAQIKDSFSQTGQIATGLGITGTPSYVVGDEVVVGALGQEVIMSKVANMRKCGSANC